MAQPPVSAELTTDATLRQDPGAVARAVELSGPRSQPPAQVKGYDIRRCLGDGAYGSVWLAQEQNTGKQVAIKFYSHRRGLDWSLLNREVEKLAVLYTCRDIIGLIDVGWDADPPYYIMEYLENGSLAKLLEHGSLHVSEAVRIVTGITQALVHAHDSGILHCDLKPANVLLDRDFVPRLADFGQSRLSHEQNPALGTLFYMAPEQADLDAVPDARWDVYALGALFYHTLTGAAPHRTPQSEAAIHGTSDLDERLAVYQRIIRQGPPPRAHREIKGVDSRLAEILERCLEVDPRKRYSSARAVLDALEERARYRSRRPLIALGIVGPSLLLLALLPIAVQATMNAVRTAERNLESRAAESDAVTAKVLALSVEKGLEQRKNQLVKMAAQSELRRLIPTIAGKRRESPERQHLDGVLTSLKEEIDAEVRQLKMAPDESWFLVDADGFQRWRIPYSQTVEKNYAWRDYFHGLGPGYDEQKPPPLGTIVREPHISIPFRSRATGRFMVALSVPVWDLEKQHVIGVLARTIHLGYLLSEYKEVIRGNSGEDVNRLLALVDVPTGKLLDHPWMTSQNLQEIPRETVDQLLLADAQRERVEKLSQMVQSGQASEIAAENRDLQYLDPVALVNEEAQDAYGGTWLAAFWPVQNARWVALVQERRDDALQPVREIQRGLVRYALSGLLLCCAVVATLWYFVMRAMTARTPRLGRGEPLLRGTDRSFTTGSTVTDS